MRGEIVPQTRSTSYVSVGDVVHGFMMYATDIPVPTPANTSGMIPSIEKPEKELYCLLLLILFR